MQDLGQKPFFTPRPKFLMQTDIWCRNIFCFWGIMEEVDTKIHF